jgi:uncharacterized protein YhaN
MRIRRLRIPAYGLFADCDFDQLPGGLGVVYGLNETGKSTLFSILKSLLYGFYPVVDFPYRPWRLDMYPQFQANIKLEDGRVAQIKRRLTKTAATGTLELDGKVQELSNHDLPFVRHVSMDLYESLYALTQKNKQELGRGTQQEIEDRLLGGLGSDILRPTREIIAQLQEKGNQLWRPDNRGNPVDKALRRELKETREAKREAKKNDELLREKAKRLSDVNRQLEDCKKELARANARIKQGEKLFPLKRRLLQIGKWLKRVPDIEAANKLPDGLKAEYRRLSDRVAAAQKDLQGLKDETQALGEELGNFTGEHRRILRYEDQIVSWTHRISGHEKELDEIRKAERNAAKAERELRRLAEGILGPEWKDIYSGPLRSIVLPDLKSRIQAYSEHQQDIRDIEVEARKTPSPFVMRTLAGWLVLGVGGGGLALILVGILFSISILTEVGIGMALLWLAGSAFNRYLRGQKLAVATKQKKIEEKLEEAREKAQMRKGKTGEKIREIFAGLPVAESLIERPDMELYRTVEYMQRTLSQLEALKAEIRTRSDEWGKVHSNLQTLISEFEVGDSSEGIEQLENRLRNAQRLRDGARRAEKRIEEIEEKELPERQEKLISAQDELDVFTGKVKRAVPADMTFEETLNKAEELQEMVHRIRNAEVEMEEKYPDLEGLKKEIRELEEKDEEPELRQEEIEKANIRRDDLNNRIHDLREMRGKLKTDIENVQDQVSVGELEGKIERLKEEQERIRTERDRLALLAHILWRADRDFREKHQPDVLLRASEYLRTVTGNRYQGLTMMETKTGEERLTIKTAGDDYRPVGPPLSSGTLDQIYFSFRLAVIDHLDEDHEPLPLVLDEVLINWDDERFAAGVKILSEIARRRQVFLFTCHDWLAQRLHKATGAPVLRLGPGQ